MSAVSLALLFAEAPACSSSSSGTFATDAGTGGSAEGGADGGSTSSGGSAEGGKGGKGGSSAGGSGGSGPPLLDCVTARIELGSNVASGTTVSGTDNFSASCVVGTGSDVAWEWTAPETDFYAIDTLGSSFDTVLAVFANCDGADLWCNNNTASTPQSELIIPFAAGERVVLVVDGNSGESGDVQLNVERVTCPGTDLTGQPLPASLSTVGGTNAQAGVCGGAGSREKTYRYTPPADGLYRFTVTSEVFDPALHLELGPRCGGTLLSCNANVRDTWPVQVSRYLTGGVPVTLIVDSTSGEGAFELDVEPLPSALCPTHADFNFDGPETIDDLSQDVLSASCRPAGGQGSLGGLGAYREDSYPLHIDIPVGNICNYTVTGSAPFTMFMIRGTQCEGEEYECLVATDGGAGFQTSRTFNDDDSGDYVFVVESAMPDMSFEYTVAAYCL